LTHCPQALGAPLAAPDSCEERRMLTLKDCIAMSDLSDAEVAAIAEHEHVPEIIAAEIGFRLVDSRDGRRILKRYIQDNLVHAKAHHLEGKAKDLALLLRRFEDAHPTRRHV
jgi:hypothetical protein